MVRASVRGLFRTLSRVRGARIFHPDGEAFEARWTPLDVRVFAGTGLAEERRAIVRLSQAVGLPDRAPDILGVAIKVLDAHGHRTDQDLLLASTVDDGRGRHVLWPARTFTAATFSSVLAHRVGTRRAVLVARVRSAGPVAMADLRGAPPPAIEVLLDDADGRHLARLELGRPLGPLVSQELRFDPWHAGPGLRPVGLLNRIRRPAYRASQQGRGAPRRGARDAVEPATSTDGGTDGPHVAGSPSDTS